ncbi:nitrogen regulatory protein OTam [Phyllosticta citrichinensis]|uniref:Nitrogen regulatory protein OTam n=1 Tax=Phyllosticta citrichinensis TaxID=1130410 RepID=A0ABR1XRZ9_9PEZI
MSTAVAIHPAMPRPAPDLVPIAAARPKTKSAMPGKENVFPLKPHSSQAQITPAVRSRRERPCDACRRRKSRCVIHDGALLCVLCEFHKQDCTFVQSPLPRKRKTHNQDSQSDQGVKKRSVDRELSRQPPTPLQRSPRTRFSPHVPQARDTTAHTLQETLGLQRKQHSKYIGPTTPLDPLLISLAQFDHRNESTTDLGVLRKVDSHEHFIMLPDENTQDNDHEIEALNAVEAVVAPHGSTLMDIYFGTVHPSFPVIQKSLFMQRHRDADRQISPPLLAGIYILALQWLSHDSRLASLPKPDVARLEAIAYQWMPKAMERPKLSTIQAGLLLLQCPDSDAWSLTTQLVAIGQELGLHLDCTNWTIPLWERGLRKRIAWALYMQDKWSSLIHGRPSHIFSADWAVEPLTDEDFCEEGASQTGEVLRAGSEDEAAEDGKGAYVYAQMITLTAIMAEVMDTFYTQTAIQDFRAAGKNSTRLILERAKPVQIKLKEWFARLPPSTRIIDSQSNSRASTSTATGALHLAYFATEITLHRRIVQSLDPDTSDPYLLFICRSAAKTRLISAMDFVNRLTPAHLQSFWYFASKINFTLIGTFGSLLWATAPGKEEADFYRTRLREYRWTLSVSASQARWLDYAIRVLDASREMLKGVDEKPRLADQVHQPPRHDQPFSVSDSGVPSWKTGLSSVSVLSHSGFQSTASSSSGHAYHRYTLHPSSHHVSASASLDVDPDDDHMLLMSEGEADDASDAELDGDMDADELMEQEMMEDDAVEADADADADADEAEERGGLKTPISSA